MSNALSSARMTFCNRLSVGGTASVSPDDQEKTSINSPLLFDMLTALLPAQQHIILDVGQASGSSIDYFNDYWCKVFIADFASKVHKLDPVTIDNRHKWHRTLVRSIGLYKRNRAGLDVILLWDLPNYLSPDHLKGLISYLLPHVSEHVLIHAYLYSARRMPARPANYHIQANRTIAVNYGTEDSVDSPMYHQTVLQKYLAPFTVKRAVMLSSGIQEYLFHLD